MQPSYDNNFLASFYLWAEHVITQQNQAYNTLTTPLYPTADPTLPAGYQGYSCPVKGWVYDSGVSGAVIINAVSGGGFSAPLTRGSGVHFDYVNARVIVPTSLGTNLALTGTASVREVNMYLPNESEWQILTEGKYFVNPRYTSPALASGAPPNLMATPAIFVNMLHTHNEPYQLGGLVNTKSIMSLTVLAESNYQLTAILGTFRDQRYNYLPLLSVSDDPLDGWNDVKGGTGYNYVGYVGRFGTPGNLAYIEDVQTSKVSDKVKLNPFQFAGLVDLTISYVRLPPIASNLFV